MITHSIFKTIILVNTLLFNYDPTTQPPVNDEISADFPIQNDWHYAELTKPAKYILEEEFDERGNQIESIGISFDDQGFITEIKYDDYLKQIYEPYHNNERRIIFIYEANEEAEQQILDTKWVTPTQLRFDDNDLVIDNFFDDKGAVIRAELFLDDPNTPKEITHFSYFNQNDQKPTRPTNTSSEKHAYITILETDEYGNWTRQVEESDKSTITRTREFQYYP